MAVVIRLSAEVTTLRREWPKAAFETLRRQAPDIERLRRDDPNRADKAFRYGGPGYCGVCDMLWMRTWWHAI